METTRAFSPWAASFSPAAKARLTSEPVASKIERQQIKVFQVPCERNKGGCIIQPAVQRQGWHPSMIIAPAQTSNDASVNWHLERYWL